MEDDSTEQATQRARRRTVIEPIPVASILASGGPNSPIRPPPAEHIGLSESPDSSVPTYDAFKAQLPSHIRAASSADILRQGKRLSLNLPMPIQPPTGRPSRPPSWGPSGPSPIPSPVLVSPPSEGNFMTALAAQERKVLELKDELKQAEQDLEKLKKQWASHEATRKRNDIRKVQPLQPLNIGLANLDIVEDDVDGSSVWMQKEMERRKQLLNNVKLSHRKVFSGSRHTRTLSLLSPDKLKHSATFSANRNNRSEDTPTRPPALTRSSTTSDVAAQIMSAKDDKFPDIAGVPRDALLRTGKQMATDFKDGLWTFFEDIRQATVGEEGVNGTGLRSAQTPNTIRRQSKANLNTKPPQLGRSLSTSSKKTLKAHSASDESTLIDIGGSFWRDHGVDEPAAKTGPKNPSAKALRTPQKQMQDDEDSWETWDTPVSQPSASSGTSSGDEDSAPRSSSISTPRTSTSSNGIIPPNNTEEKPREAIPWPVLEKLSPGNLKRTASHLMNEWEKSLSAPPPPEDAEAREMGNYLSPSEGKDKKGD